MSYHELPLILGTHLASAAYCEDRQRVSETENMEDNTTVVILTLGLGPLGDRSNALGYDDLKRLEFRLMYFRVFG